MAAVNVEEFLTNFDEAAQKRFRANPLLEFIIQGVTRSYLGGACGGGAAAAAPAETGAATEAKAEEPEEKQEEEESEDEMEEFSLFD